MRSTAMIVSLFAAFAMPSAQGADPKADGSRVENPFRGVMQDRSSHSPGEALFVEKCGMCHRQMGMGTVILARRMDRGVAMLESRADLSAPLIAVAVRRGIGNMPRIPRGEVSDAQLARISDYLVSRSKTASKAAANSPGQHKKGE